MPNLKSLRFRDVGAVLVGAYEIDQVVSNLEQFIDGRAGGRIEMKSSLRSYR